MAAPHGLIYRLFLRLSISLDDGWGYIVFPELRFRPTVEDILRAVAYLGVAVWCVLFLVYPPVAYVSLVDFITRLCWVGACGIGALTAFVGSLIRMDLKVELPGIAFMLIGPLFYGAAQIWLIVNPFPDTDPTARNALAMYAFLPLLFTLPRMYALYRETQRSSALRTANEVPPKEEQ